MHYILGKSIREKYAATLFKDPPKYSDYEVTSSQVQRTMLSAYSHMMGLYPLGSGLDTTNEVDDTKLPPFASAASSFEGKSALEGGYRAIPVNVLATETDFIFMRAFDTYCKKAKAFVTTESDKRANSKERMELIAPVAKGITDAGYNS